MASSTLRLEFWILSGWQCLCGNRQTAVMLLSKTWTLSMEEQMGILERALTSFGELLYRSGSGVAVYYCILSTNHFGLRRWKVSSFGGLEGTQQDQENRCFVLWKKRVGWLSEQSRITKNCLSSISLDYSPTLFCAPMWQFNKWTIRSCRDQYLFSELL